MLTPSTPRHPIRTGYASLPLHHGRAPRWLFERMVKLAREVCLVVVEEFGPEEMVRRLADPFWFQAFGCVLGFDWHSSGVTTTVCRALKEGVRGLEKELGFFVAGGKDGHPYPVDCETYDRSIKLLNMALRKARLGHREQMDALRRLHIFV